MSSAVQALQSQTHARVILLTPTPVVEALANHLPPGFHHRMRWNNADLRKYGDGLGEIGNAHDAPVIDMFTIFGTPPDHAYFLDDGVHLNAAGERLMLEQIAAQLKL
jgi:lysophospholipase L1-like esterase